MDDLDHSMRIAEDDWMRFFEECEECALPQPLPASPDNWGLSDLEDSDFTAGHEGQESPATGDKAKRSASRRHGGNHSLSGGENDDLSSKADSESERWVLCPNCSAIKAAAVNTRAGEHVTRITTSLRTENDQTADDGQKADTEWQSDTSSTCDPLPRKQGAGDLSGNEPHGTAGAASSVTLRTQKERWFVTVNDSPARQRVRVTSAKKKRRLKQPRKNKRLSQSSGWEKLQKNHVESEANNEIAKCNNYNKSSSKEIQKANVLANPGLFQRPLTSDQHDGAKYDPSCRAPSLHDACANTGLPGSDRAESDVLADTAECCESDSYPPATESFGEPQQLLMDPEENTATPPSAAHIVSKTPDEDSACERDTRCTQGSVATLTSGARTHEMNSSPSVCGLSGDQLSPASLPVFTPCSAADNPERRAAAAGHTRPVYAISAFWDDMEKVTINDILQLRVARGTPLGVADKSPHISLETNHLTDSKSAGGVPLDTSDTADSDYFTQLDESKPDHWGGDLSASDFEEEQLLGASRNSSPDLQQSKQPRASCSPYLADEEGESTASEGVETPVPAGDFTQTCLEDHKCVDLYSNSFVQVQRLVKSKSMHNVRALSNEDLSVRGEDESRPVLCSLPDKNSSEIPFLSNKVTSDNHKQMFSPEVFEGVIREDKAKRVSGAVLLYDPDLDYSLLTFRDEILFTFLHYSQETIPIFSYSRPVIRTFTFPSSVFLNSVCKVKHFLPPLGVVPGSPGNGGTTAVVPHGFHSNKDKAGIWYRCSGAWMLPLDMVALRRADPPVNAVTERGVASTPRQSASAEQQIWEMISITSKSKMS